MKNISLIGISGFGSTHYEGILEKAAEGGWRFHSAAVINQDEEKEKVEVLRGQGTLIYEDYRRMLEENKGEIDLVFVPTGIHLHTPMTIEALEAGANVLVEKPLAATVQEVNSIKKKSLESGCFTAVGYQNMYAPETFEIKKQLLSGEFGELQCVKCLGLWPRDDSYYSRNNWAGKLKVGDSWVLDSPFNNALAHYLNLSLFFAGNELEKSADVAAVQVELYKAREDIEAPDLGSFRISTSDGKKIYFHAAHCTDLNYGPQIEVICSEGTVSWSNRETVFKRKGRGDYVHENSSINFMRERMYELLDDRIDGKDSFLCSPEIAGVQVLCNNAAYESSDIRLLPERFLRRKVLDGGKKVTVLESIDKIAFSAFENEKLFSECDVPWASPGREFNVKGYEFFRGPGLNA